MTAPFINGLFMECDRSDGPAEWIRIENTLMRAEAHLRKPRINYLETWHHASRNDLNLMRATTTLALTRSDGYALFSDPIHCQVRIIGMTGMISGMPTSVCRLLPLKPGRTVPFVAHSPTAWQSTIGWAIRRSRSVSSSRCSVSDPGRPVLPIPSRRPMETFS